MEPITFGNTNLKVSRIGLGLAALGRPGYINLGHGNDLNFNYDENTMYIAASKVLDAACENGIRYFDTARSYGKAELFLSRWINQKSKKDNIIVGSKWGYTYTAGWKVSAEKHEIKEHTAKILNCQWEESSHLLGHHLKFYHIHSATQDSGVLANQEVLDKLWELKRSGIIIGLSLSGVSQSETLETALNIKSGSEQLFQSAQITWNILEQSCTEILLKAAAKGMGIIVKESLANGKLTDRNKDVEFRDKMELLKNMAEKYKTGIDALSIAYVLQQPWSSIVLSGAVTIQQLESNLKAQNILFTKTDLDILKNMAEYPPDYWKARGRMQWN